MHAWWSELRSRALLPAMEPAPGTVEVLHAVAGGPSSGPCDSGRFLLGVRGGRTPSKNLPESQGPRERPTRTACTVISAVGDLTAPVKIYLQVVVQIHRNEHEFPFNDPVCGFAPAAPAAARARGARPRP